MTGEPIYIRYIETTGRCNLNCPVCVERYRNYDMKQEDFLEIVNRNASLFLDRCVWLDFNGEPLLDPLFFERVKLLKQKGAIVQISTNGILLNHDNIIKIVESGVDYLVISVITLDPLNYKQIRGVDMLREIIENVKKLKLYVDKAGSSMEIQAVAIDTGTEDLTSFIDYFHSIGIHAGVHQFTNRAHCSRKTYKTTHQKLEKRGACQGRKQNLVVLCNCDVVSCCCDFKGVNVLGNLRDYDYSVIDLVRKSKFDAFFLDQENQIFKGACAKCDDWIYYQKESTEKYVTVYPVYGGIE